jgi:hypothetical protein
MTPLILFILGLFAVSDASPAGRQMSCEDLVAQIRTDKDSYRRNAFATEARSRCTSTAQLSALTAAVKAGNDTAAAECSRYVEATYSGAAALAALSTAERICHGTALSERLDQEVDKVIVQVTPPDFVDSVRELEKVCRIRDLLPIDQAKSQLKLLATICNRGTDESDVELRILQRVDGTAKTVFKERWSGYESGFPAEFRELQGTDINGDHWPELIVEADAGGSASVGPRTIYRWKGGALEKLYTGPVVRIEDLNGDGRRELLEVAQTREDEPDACNACREMEWRAQEWNGAKYSPAKDARIQHRLAEMLQAERAQTLTNLEERKAKGDEFEPWENARLTRLKNEKERQEKTAAAKQRAMDIRLGLKPDCPADAAYLPPMLLSLKVGMLKEAVVRNCRVHVGMATAVSSTRDGWTMVTTDGGDTIAAVEGTYQTGSFLSSGDLRFLGLRKFTSTSGTVVVLPSFAPVK